MAVRSAAVSAPTWLAMSGAPDHASVRVHEQPDLVAAAADPGGRRAPGEHRDLGDRLVRELPDRRDVDAEVQVAHRAVGHDHGLVDLVAIDAVLAIQVAQLVVEGAAQGEAHRAREVRLVRDAGHDIAAAEPLWVLDGRAGQGVAGQEVDDLEDDRRGPDVDGQAQDVVASQVDRLAVVADGHVVRGHDRIEADVRLIRRPQDAHPPADDRELDVARDVLDLGLAGQAELALEVGLGLRSRGESLAPLADLDDALATAPRPPARGRHRARDLVGIVEQGPTGDERAMLGPLDDVRHSRLLGREAARSGDSGRRARSADYPTLVAVLQTLPQPPRAHPVGHGRAGRRSALAAAGDGAAARPRREGRRQEDGPRLARRPAAPGASSAAVRPRSRVSRATDAIGGWWSSDRSTSSQVTSEMSSGTRMPWRTRARTQPARTWLPPATIAVGRGSMARSCSVLRSPCSAERDPTRLIVSSRDATRRHGLGHAGDPLADRPQVQGAGDESHPSMAQVQQVPDGRPHARPVVVADDAGAEFGRARRGRS